MSENVSRMVVKYKTWLNAVLLENKWVHFIIEMWTKWDKWVFSLFIFHLKKKTHNVEVASLFIQTILVQSMLVVEYVLLALVHLPKIGVAKQQQKPRVFL